MAGVRDTDTEQSYDTNANRDIIFTRFAGDYEIKAAIVSSTKRTFSTHFLTGNTGPIMSNLVSTESSNSTLTR